MFHDGPAALQRDCPYIRTIPAEVLTQKPWSSEVRKLLQDKLVLYGGSFQGAADLVQSPTHGSIPGVQLHAMALHNLLLWGDNYISPSRAPQSSMITPAGIESVTVFFTYGLFVGILFLWSFFVAEKEARCCKPEGHSGFSILDLIKRFDSRFGVFLVGFFIVVVLLGGMLLAQWEWFRLSPINWLGILGLFVAFLSLFTPYVDRLPPLDVDGAEAEKEGE
jgi:hypothetical protein